ncbi:tight adherence protein B [Mobilisporobacter senegalensis]|uniref:Tight adherence protein B n=2 Tax=Mobilisporobacter senegalensis TaxID=1329262 RepID=A0A3N1XA73_9FIRM|nr:tight adherence protein B [Mobilisporobacter senegalensis]
MSGIGYLFYKSFLGIFLLSPFSILYLKYKKNKLIEERKWKLNLEFRDGIMSISSSLNAGYSIENSLSEAIGDLKILYGESSYIVNEFEYMASQIRMNRTIEEVLQEFANRSQLEDIHNFAEVFITAKRTGGDMIKIIRATSKVIGDKVDVKREIKTLITAKQFETKIMNLIPLGIILYMWMFSPGFLDPLYHNLFGIIIMTAALIVYIVSFLLSKKIINIEI